MTVLITLTTIGTDCSLFDIYSNVDGFISAFETDVPKASLSSGFSSANVPDGTTVIRVKAKGVCTNYIDITLSTITTTTTSSTSTTTTTTTVPPECLLYSMTAYPLDVPVDLGVKYRDCTTGNIVEKLINTLSSTDNLDGTYTHYVCVKQNSTYSSPVFVQDSIEVSSPNVWIVDNDCSPIE